MSQGVLLCSTPQRAANTFREKSEPLWPRLCVVTERASSLKKAYAVDVPSFLVQVEELQAQLVERDAEIASLKAQLAELRKGSSVPFGPQEAKRRRRN